MMLVDSLNQHKTVVFGGVIIALILLISGIIIYTNNQASQTPVANTLSASANYDASGHAKTLALTVTLSGNTITDLTLKDRAEDGTSSKYEVPFSDAAKLKIVGHSIKEQFDTSTINGSSLTSVAFFQALDQIKAQVN